MVTVCNIKRRNLLKFCFYNFTLIFFIDHPYTMSYFIFRCKIICRTVLLFPFCDQVKKPV